MQQEIINKLLFLGFKPSREFYSRKNLKITLYNTFCTVHNTKTNLYKMHYYKLTDIDELFTYILD